MTTAWEGPRVLPEVDRAFHRALSKLDQFLPDVQKPHTSMPKSVTKYQKSHIEAPKSVIKYQKSLSNLQTTPPDRQNVACWGCFQQYPKYSLDCHKGLCRLCYDCLPNQLDNLPKDYVHEYTPEQRSCLRATQNTTINFVEHCSLAAGHKQMAKEWVVMSQKTRETRCCLCLRSQASPLLLLGNTKTGDLLVMSINCAKKCGFINTLAIENVRREHRRNEATLITYRT